MIDRNEYILNVNLVGELSGRTYLHIPLKMVRCIGGEKSIMFSYLLRLFLLKHDSRQGRRKLAEEDFWFRCLITRIQSKLNMDREYVLRVISDLQDSNLIWTERRVGNSLWIKFNYGAMSSFDNCENPYLIKDKT